MDAIASEILALLNLAGLSLADSTVETEHVLLARDGSGTITIDISQHECLIVPRIKADNVDWAFAATMGITLGTKAQPPLTTPFETIVDEPLMLVFESGRLVFTFSAVAVVGLTARIKIHAVRLPNEAVRFLRQMATKVA